MVAVTRLMPTKNTMRRKMPKKTGEYRESGRKEDDQNINNVTP